LRKTGGWNGWYEIKHFICSLVTLTETAVGHPEFRMVEKEPHAGVTEGTGTVQNGKQQEMLHDM